MRGYCQWASFSSDDGRALGRREVVGATTLFGLGILPRRCIRQPQLKHLPNIV